MKRDDGIRESDKHYEFDVALSYAGEDRQFADSLAAQLKQRGINIFYDQYEKPFLWGKDLYTHLSNIYKKEALFCVVLISKHYDRKIWTKHELRAAQDRAIEENREYILPIRLDNTEISGIFTTTAYLSWPPETAETIANAIMQKLHIIKLDEELKADGVEENEKIARPKTLTFALMAGLAATGKTTLALAVGRAFGWQVVSKDNNLTTLLTLDSSLTNTKAGWIGYELAFASVRDLLVAQHLSTILDTAASRPFIIDQARRIADEAKAQLKVIYCTVPAKLRLERLKSRISNSSYPPFMASHIHDVDEIDHFKHLPEDKLILDTSQPLATCLERAIRYLSK